ncbi:MAG: hypothetical protein BWX60_00536 [Candidatus Marinimicrobia bacterium ADurb.Bin030]|nr:MAG: hypothetical protein BWX60_00536 [Candidatus Marinimicrobia bacterium ADurb.Bin030]
MPVQRHKISRLRQNIIIFRLDNGISRPVPTDGFKFVKWFANRLPGSRPIIMLVKVVDIKITPRLIHRNRIETQTHESPLRRRLKKTVATGIVSNYRTVLGRTKIIAPTSRSIRPINYIFFILIVKMTKLHI